MIRVTGADRTKLQLSNSAQIVMPCEGKLWSYLELLDRVILVVNIYDTKHCNQFRNIFCYSKEDGHLIWQVEQAYGRDHQPLEAVYKYVNLKVKQDDGSYDYGHKSIQHECGIWGKVYFEPFRYGVDRLEAMTLCEFPSEYWIDYETGKVEWFAIHQKV